MSGFSEDKMLSPKSNYKFNNNLLNRSRSTDKLYNNINKSKDSNKELNSTVDSGVTSVHNYLQRRHTEAQAKLMRIKNERLNKEMEELRDRPKLSKNSLKIAHKLRESSQNVVDRLTDKNQVKRKEIEINKLQELNNQSTGAPKINETSNKLQRTIDDLYYWKQNLDEKKQKLADDTNLITSQNPTILRESEEILKEKKPKYLDTKVEDRLLERGRMNKYKLEEAKETQFDRVVAKPINPPSLKRSASAVKKVLNTNPSTTSLKRDKSTDKIKPIVNTPQRVLAENYKSDSRIIPNISTFDNNLKVSTNQSQRSRPNSNKKQNTNSNFNMNINNSNIKEDEKFQSDEIMGIRKHLNNYYSTKNSNTISNEFGTINNHSSYRPDLKKVYNSDDKKLNAYVRNKEREIRGNDITFKQKNEQADLEVKPQYLRGDIEPNYDDYYNDLNKDIPDNEDNTYKNMDYNNYASYNEDKLLYTFEDKSSKDKPKTLSNPDNKNINTSNTLNTKYNFKKDFVADKQKQSPIDLNEPNRFKRNSNSTSYNNKVSSISTDIRNSSDTPSFQRRVEDVNDMQAYLNNLEISSDKGAKANSHEFEGNNENRHSKGRDNLEASQNRQSFADSQLELDRMRNGLNRKLQSSVYSNEVNRVNNNIDYVNERLKLNEVSKSYVMNKIHEFTTVKTGNAVDTHIGSSFEEFRRKKN